jgi:hypothetical protein
MRPAKRPADRAEEREGRNDVPLYIEPPDVERRQREDQARGERLSRRADRLDDIRFQDKFRGD